MPIYYCHSCAISGNHVKPVATVSLSGTQYQLDKFLKHTAPCRVFPENGQFNDPSYGNYSGYVVSGIVSGCLEIDDQGRKNMLWLADKAPGATYVGGRFQISSNAIKVVLPEDTMKIHAFPVFASGLQAHTCATCGATAVSASVP